MYVGEIQSELPDGYDLSCEDAQDNDGWTIKVAMGLS